MADELPGKDTSLWIDTTKKTNYPPLQNETISCDVAIVGGGITGLLLGWFLQQESFDTVIVDKSRLVEYTTGNTTAKLTSQHYLIYKYLIDNYGEEVARSYAKANEDAIDEIEALAKQLDIDCDFSRRDAYVFTNEDKAVHDIQAEVAASQKIGLKSSFETTTDLPFTVKAAIKFTDQAQFHPRKFLLGIIKNLDPSKTRIFEKTEATGINPGPMNILETKQGNIKARYIVEACKYSFWRYDLFEKAGWTKLSYVLGVRLKIGSQYPKGMYITTDQPIRTIRSHPYMDDHLLIFGGEGHELKGELNSETHYKNLVSDVKKKFDIEAILYRWLAGDFMTHDRMPYIGEYPDTPGVYIATGFRAWGLAWAMAASKIITSKIMSQPVEWAEPFSLKRLMG
jgi:glycine/D-amino acid oxidase-like deaminating enzyme